MGSLHQMNKIKINLLVMEKKKKFVIVCFLFVYLSHYY